MLVHTSSQDYLISLRKWLGWMYTAQRGQQDLGAFTLSTTGRSCGRQWSEREVWYPYL